MNRTSRAQRLPRATVFIALFVILPVITPPPGNILMTGSAINLQPGVAVITCALSFGLAVSRLSPIWARRSLKGC